MKLGHFVNNRLEIQIDYFKFFFLFTVFFFFKGVEVFGENELASSTLKLLEEQYDVEKSSKNEVLKLGRPHLRQFQE